MPTPFNKEYQARFLNHKYPVLVFLLTTRIKCCRLQRCTLGTDSNTTQADLFSESQGVPGPRRD